MSETVTSWAVSRWMAFPEALLMDSPEMVAPSPPVTMSKMSPVGEPASTKVAEGPETETMVTSLSITRLLSW